MKIMKPINYTEDYNNCLKKIISEGGCKLPEAAAIARMVEFSIYTRSYAIYDSEHGYEQYQPIVMFNFVGDPLFGLYFYNGDETVILTSTPDGVKEYYL